MSKPSTAEPHPHPRLEAGRIALQAQRGAVVIADGTLGLPSRE
jgi:hypothetical protein